MKRDNKGDEFNLSGDFRHSTVTIITRVGIGLVAIAVALVVASAVFNIGPLKTLFPQPTPTAFAPATEGQSLIIVADFEDRSGGKYQGIDPAQYIYEQLTAQARKDNLDVRIERLRHTVDDNTVRPTGETYSATLVLWGWYDALAITPRVERIKTRSDYRSTEEGTHFSLVDPTKIEFSIITDLPSQASYVTLLALGFDKDTGGNGDAALAYFNSAILAVPSNANVTTVPAEAYFARGLIYYDKSDYERTIADYNEAIQLNPSWAEAYSNRGIAYDTNGDSDRALADFNQAIQLMPNFSKAYNNRGVAYAYKGDYGSAITDFDQAIQLNPEDANAYNNRGVAYAAKGDSDRALADYNQALQLKPDDANAYNNRGNAYAANGGYALAISDYNQAIQIKPDNADSYFNRGIAYDAMGDSDRALADYDQAIRLKPDYAKAYVNRGITYGKKRITTKLSLTLTRPSSWSQTLPRLTTISETHTTTRATTITPSSISIKLSSSTQTMPQPTTIVDLPTS